MSTIWSAINQTLQSWQGPQVAAPIVLPSISHGTPIGLTLVLTYSQDQLSHTVATTTAWNYTGTLSDIWDPTTHPQPTWSTNTNGKTPWSS